MLNLKLNDVKCWLLIHVLFTAGKQGIFGLVFLVSIHTERKGSEMGQFFFWEFAFYGKGFDYKWWSMHTLFIFPFRFWWLIFFASKRTLFLHEWFSKTQFLFYLSNFYVVAETFIMLLFAADKIITIESIVFPFFSFCTKFASNNSSPATLPICLDEVNLKISSLLKSLDAKQHLRAMETSRNSEINGGYR